MVLVEYCQYERDITFCVPDEALNHPRQVPKRAVVLPFPAILLEFLRQDSPQHFGCTNPHAGILVLECLLQNWDRRG